MFSGPYTSVPPTVAPRWRRIGAQQIVPVDLYTVKDFISRPREDTFWDAEIGTFIDVAAAEIERDCHLSLTPSVFEVTVPMFADRIKLSKYRPFVDVSEIKYVASGTGEITTLASSVYHALPVDQECGMVFLGDGQSWPDAAVRHDAVRITVKAGYALDDDDVLAGYPERPPEITHALLMTIAALDMARGDTQASPGSNVTVYAMKNSKGGSIVPQEARTMLARHAYRWITVG